ncbi:MAG TPA: TRAP transporter large permease subunit [Verrucomicrobiae bacterium]|nr:TRAP transporter large permease subunit [Verrucomicrobiae bacterium]
MSLPAADQVQSPPSLIRRAENSLLVAALAIMMAIPPLEAALRKFLHTGVPNANGLVQHLTLIVGMVGGAIAAREHRLLAMAALPGLLQGRWRAAAAIFSASVGVVITVFLCAASWMFFQTERAAGGMLIPGVPVWVIQAILPAGFAVIAGRVLGLAGGGWKSKVISFLIAAALFALAMHPPVSPEKMVWPGLFLLIVAAVLGAPVFVLLGGMALILFWGDDQPIASVSISHYKLVTDASLPTIPLFTLAGYFLAEGGASQRLLRLFQAMVGQFRGGPAIVTCLVCAFFTTFTGASGVTILALGGLLMPVLVSARYSERNALGLVTSAGSLGLLFPPCLPLILYAIIAKQTVTIKQMFLGGVLPGVVLVALTAALGIWQAPREEAAARQKFDLGELGRAFWAAKWELMLPVVAFVGLFGGFATPVETAALTACYALFVQVAIYRDLKITRDIPRVMTECGMLVGGVLLILGVALGFTYYLVDAQVPDKLAEWAFTHVHSKWLFLLGLNLVLILVGGLIEIYAAIVVVVPLLVPLGLRMGIDPVHLGIIFLANMELGFLAPPIGLNLLLSSYRFGKPVGQVTIAVLPMLAILFIGVLLITYFPPLTTFLPNWLGK